MGICTAYYLANLYGIRCTLIDPTGSIAPAASGKAGGFLALDWNYHCSTGPLTRRSFELHQELADILGAESIQYRRLTGAAVSVDPYNYRRRPHGKKLDGIEWAANENDNHGRVLGVRPRGDESTIAQVHPKLLCIRLWEEACRAVDSCKLVKGKVIKADKVDSVKGRQSGVELDDGTIFAVTLSCSHADLGVPIS